MSCLSSDIEKLGLPKNDLSKLLLLLKANGVSSPIVLRDHRKRGPIYWSLIFDAAKNAPEIFGLPPLKMINFKGIYVADSGNYNHTVEQVAGKIHSAEAIEAFSKAKQAADQTLNNFTAELYKAAQKKISPGQQTLLIKKFYEVRYPYTEYSFFFGTITKSLDLIMQRMFSRLGFSDAERQLAYVSDADTVEFVFLRRRSDFIKKYGRELGSPGGDLRSRPKQFIADLDRFMGEFADMDFVNFESALQTRAGFLKKTILGRSLGGKPVGSGGLLEEKRKLLDEMLPEAAEKGIDPVLLQALFSFAGNLSAWESEARHTWTRLHRAAKPLIEEIGARAAKKGLLKSKKQVFKKEIKEIIKISQALGT